MSDTTESTASRGGILDSVKNLAATLITMVQTRLEIITTEYEEERERLLSLLIWTMITLFSAILAVVLATLLVVVYYWDSYRLLSIVVMLSIFTISALVAWRVMRNKSRNKPRLFTATIAVLTKDRMELTSKRDRHGNE